LAVHTILAPVGDCLAARRPPPTPPTHREDPMPELQLTLWQRVEAGGARSATRGRRRVGPPAPPSRRASLICGQAVRRSQQGAGERPCVSGPRKPAATERWHRPAAGIHGPLTRGRSPGVAEPW